MKAKKTLALYLHIPFCVKKCNYCDFLSRRASEEEKKCYVERMIAELFCWKERIGTDYEIQTVFLGGGTPTCLSANALCYLGEAIKQSFSMKRKAEYTIEANPGTVLPAHLLAFQEMGVNRVSLGLQSADVHELSQLGRIHTFEDFVQTYHLLRMGGFENVNVDLMMDIPGQTMESYQRTLREVCTLHPEHISSYSLIVEEGTPFFEMQKKGELCLPDEETDREMYDFTECYLREYGYIRYEISNYAKQGWECRHNQTYWELGEYLGIGLGASSFFEGERFRNETDFFTYCRQPVEDSIGGAERHRLTKQEKMEEFVFLGLRQRKGISVSEYERQFGISFFSVYEKILEKFLEQGFLGQSKDFDRIFLTKKGIDVSNLILAEFLL